MAMPKLVVECARGRDALVDLKGVPNIGPDDVAKNDEPQAGPCDVFAARSDDLTAPRVRFGGSEICGVDRHLEVAECLGRRQANTGGKRTLTSTHSPISTARRGLGSPGTADVRDVQCCVPDDGVVVSRDMI